MLPFMLPIRTGTNALCRMDDRMLADVGLERIDTWPSFTYRQVDRPAVRQQTAARPKPLPSIREIMRVLLPRVRNAR